MVSNSSSRWTVAGTTFLLWALVAGSAVYWGMKLGSGTSTVPATPAARASAPTDPAAVARVLGATASAAAPVPTLASRFSLLGVVAGAAREGAALISVDGKPAKPFRVGAQVEEGLLLQSVDARHAALGATMDGPPAVTLELPLRK